MGIEQQAIGDGAPASTIPESQLRLQFVAEQQPKQEEVKQEAKPAAKPEAVPEGRGGAPGGAPGGGFHPEPPARPPERPPEGPPRGGGGESGGQRPPDRPPERPPEGPPRGGGGGEGGGKKPPEGPPEGPPKRPPEGPPEGPPKRPPDGPPNHPPDHPPDRPPGHQPRPEPHPGDPTHGFHPGRPFEPPQGGHWGWQDPGRWNRGWDPFFFRHDPNFGAWGANIDSEAQYIASLLDSGNAVGAANELNGDMFQMRGDIYAQDQLMSRTTNFEVGGPGAATLNLGNWNPILGTWDNSVITPAPGDPTPPIPVEPFDRFGNPL